MVAPNKHANAHRKERKKEEEYFSSAFWSRPWRVSSYIPSSIFLWIEKEKKKLYFFFFCVVCCAVQLCTCRAANVTRVGLLFKYQGPPYFPLVFLLPFIFEFLGDIKMCLTISRRFFFLVSLSVCWFHLVSDILMIFQLNTQTHTHNPLIVTWICGWEKAKKIFFSPF